MWRPATRGGHRARRARIAVAFVLGQGRDRLHATRAGSALCHPDQSGDGAAETERFWDETLSAVQIHTPDDSFDLIVNRWLLVPDVGLPRVGAQRSIPARRRVRFSRSTSGRAGAHVHASGAVSRAPSSRRPRGNSSRVTCNIGGIRPAGAEPERAAQTTSYGCRTRSLAMCRRAAMNRCWMKRSHSSRHRLCRPSNPRRTSCRARRRNGRRCSSMRYAPSSMR